VSISDRFERSNYFVYVTAVGNTNRNSNAVFCGRTTRFIDDFCIADDPVWQRNFYIISG
jgi:hypothetical protein